jgi:hypothetical protein
MFADTDAIRALGAANSAQAADLAAVAAALSSVPGPAAGAMLGDRMEAGHLTAHASAGAYEDADHQLGAAVSRL